VEIKWDSQITRASVVSNESLQMTLSTSPYILPALLRTSSFLQRRDDWKGWVAVIIWRGRQPHHHFDTMVTCRSNG